MQETLALAQLRAVVEVKSIRRTARRVVNFFTLGLQISFVAQTKQTFLLLRNVVRVARALPALIFRSFRIAARLTRAVIVLQLRFIGHEERLA